MNRPVKYDYTYNRGGSGEFISWMELSQAQDKYIDHLESELYKTKTANGELALEWAKEHDKVIDLESRLAEIAEILENARNHLTETTFSDTDKAFYEVVEAYTLAKGE
jgi:hypothetical protein